MIISNFSNHNMNANSDNIINLLIQKNKESKKKYLFHFYKFDTKKHSTSLPNLFI